MRWRMFGPRLKKRFEIVGKRTDFRNDSIGLLKDVFDQAGQHIGFSAEQFRRGHNQREMVIHVVAHDRQLLVEIGNLFGRQSDRIFRQAHLNKLEINIGASGR